MAHKKILLVDDEPHVRASLKRAFYDLPFEIFEAGDGQEALDAICNMKPDLIILDIMMPKLNGYEVCRTIREDEMENNVATPLPIIMLTGQIADTDRIVGKMLGANHYLYKPCNIDELKALILTLL